MVGLLDSCCSCSLTSQPCQLVLTPAIELNAVLAGEVQACADAASERVQALETQLDTQTSDAEVAAAAAKAELESAQADAAATLIMVKAELKAALGAAETDLAGTKVGTMIVTVYGVPPHCNGVSPLY